MSKTPRTDKHTYEGITGPLGEKLTPAVITRELEDEVTALLRVNGGLTTQLNDVTRQSDLGWKRAAENDKAYADMIAQRDSAIDRVQVLINENLDFRYKITNLIKELEDWKETAQVHLEAARAMATELNGVKTALGLDGASYEPDLPLAVKSRMDLLRALSERKGMPLPP